MKKFRLSHSPVDESKLKQSLPPISEKDFERTEDVFNQKEDDEEADFLKVQKFNIPIRRKDLALLKPGGWLNDEIINFYMEMIAERANRNRATLPSVYSGWNER
ncbi:hypothetical protein ACOME3_001842 [Neoechinorhynchus agilis]